MPQCLRDLSSWTGQRFARRIVQAGKLVLSVVGPNVESEDLAELVAATAD